MLLGGDSYNQHTLSRFYVLHAAILPGTMILLIIVGNAVYFVGRKREGGAA